MSPIRASELTGRAWLNTGGRRLSLADLRGRIVLLDFWTFCCINCLHVIDELRTLEEKWADELVVIGVHSPKFTHEADPDALAANVERYELTHPVLDDPDLVTWQAYAAKAWPTLVLIDPNGYIVSSMSGEGHGPGLDRTIAALVEQHETDGTLRRGDSPAIVPAEDPSTLRFPARAVALGDGRIAVADAGHHRIVVLEADGETVSATIGSGARGRADGDAASATFAAPGGIAVLPASVARDAGVDLVIADTGNNLLRGISLPRGISRSGTAAPGELPTATVTTLAGTGHQWMPHRPLPAGDRDPVATTFDLTSPWDATWSDAYGEVVIAMAGNHQVWTYDPVRRALRVLGGTRNEGLVDGPLEDAWFAQTSGVAEDADGLLWLADAETSALRVIDPGRGDVATAIGEGLFDFGHRDGPASQARLQHPLGLTPLPDGALAIADTYNGAVRRYDPATAAVTTLASGLAEPSDVLVAGDRLLVVESVAHRLIPVPLDDGTVVDGEARSTQRPVTPIGREVALRVAFTPPPGHKLDDSFGPSTQLTVSATPPALLADGAGTGTELDRSLRLADGHSEGVLHITARAASCDADPSLENPACHLHAQDWGVPVRIEDGGTAVLDLPLHS